MENGTAIVEKFGNLEMDSGLVITGIKEQEQVEGSGCGYKKAPGDTFVVMKCSVFWLYQRQYPGCDTEIQLLQNITMGEIGAWDPSYMKSYMKIQVSQTFLKIQWNKKVFKQQIT